MMRPDFCAFIAGTVKWMTEYTLFKFTFTISFHSRSVTSSMGVSFSFQMPAFATRMSMRPNRSRVNSTSFLLSVMRLKSALNDSTRVPCLRVSCCTCSAASRFL